MPGLKVNLSSCGACLDEEIKMMTDSKGSIFKKNNHVVTVGVGEKNVFSMLIKTVISHEIEHANVVVKNYTIQHWHNMYLLGHQNSECQICS